jgi:GNAT superfamily N-acetyltransferase
MTIIRPATYDDLDMLLLIAKAMQEESPRFSRMTFSQRKMLQLFINLIDSENGLVLVAEVEGEIVGGFAGMVIEHFFTDDLVANDIGLFLIPNARGGTLAARLIKQYIAWAKTKTEFIQLGISTGVHMEKTAELYQALGLQQCSIGFEVKPCVQG